MGKVGGELSEGKGRQMRRRRRDEQGTTRCRSGVGGQEGVGWEVRTCTRLANSGETAPDSRSDASRAWRKRLAEKNRIGRGLWGNIGLADSRFWRDAPRAHLQHAKVGAHVAEALAADRTGVRRSRVSRVTGRVHEVAAHKRLRNTRGGGHAGIVRDTPPSTARCHDDKQPPIVREESERPSPERERHSP